MIFRQGSTKLKVNNFLKETEKHNATAVRECYRAAVAQAIAYQEELDKQGFPIANGVCRYRDG